MAIDDLVTRGERYLGSRDKKDQGYVRKTLESLENPLKNSKDCTSCARQLAWVYYYQARYGIRDDFGHFRDYTRKIIKQNPDDPELPYLLGNVALAEGDRGEAIAMLKRFLLLEGTKPEWQTQARGALGQAQREFLGTWYGQADFYKKTHTNIAESLQNQLTTITTLQKQLAGSGASTQSRIDATNKALQDLNAQGKQGFQWTPEIEMQLGGQALSSSKDLPKPTQDPELQKYIQDLVLKMVDKTPGPPYNYKIDVLDTDAINAFAVPGSVMVNRGLIRFAQNEAELVAVLAHEIGHNYAHHMARMYMKQSTADTGLKLLSTALAGKSQTLQTLANTAGKIVANLALLAYSRFEEREADLYATHIAFNSGYNPTYLSSMLLRMYKAGPGGPAKFLSRHPPDPERIDYLSTYLEAFPLEKEMQIDSADFQKLKQKLGSVIPAGKSKKVSPVLKP